MPTKATKKKAGSSPKSARKAPAVASAFTIGQRVTVTAPGSFAARSLGKVSAIRPDGKIAVRLDHKQADKDFAAGELAPA